ncbi:MAG: hypothetical protein KF693_17030 [Nitrospira sp.]|nr:hypothetical protein [Nitrospira sp.]
MERGGVGRSAPPSSPLELLKAGGLCNDAQHLERDGRWTIVGDPTEGALLVAANTPIARVLGTSISPGH